MAGDMKFLTVEDVAEMLQVTRTTIYNLKKQGLPFIKLGKNIRFDEEDVIDWVRSNRQVEKNEQFSDHCTDISDRLVCVECFPDPESTDFI